MARDKGECEHPYYRSITKGQKACVKCGHVIIFKAKPAPQEANDVSMDHS